MSEIIITNDNFEAEVINSNVPVLVDFWATWCGPCQIMGAVIKELAEEADGKFKICKINVDDNPFLSQKYSIMSIPTLLIFKDGIQVKKHVGSCSKAEVLDLLKDYI